MNESKSKQARDMIANAAEDNQEMKISLKELEDYESQMAEIAESVLGNGQAQEEKSDFIGSEADNAMMALAREQAKYDPELAALLKELDESEKQIARLLDMFGAEKN
jgi:hypothetical protein